MCVFVLKACTCVYWSIKYTLTSICLCIHIHLCVTRQYACDKCRSFEITLESLKLLMVPGMNVFANLEQPEPIEEARVPMMPRVVMM